MNYQYEWPKTDPIFSVRDFQILDNPNDPTGDSLFVQVYFSKNRVRYVISDFYRIKNNTELLTKMRRYMLMHEMTKKKINDNVNTYFIGETNKTINLSDGFVNQNVILVTYEMILQWYPKSMDEIMKKIVRYLSSIMDNFGQVISLGTFSDDYLFVDRPLDGTQRRQYLDFIVDGLVDKGYAKKVDGGFVPHTFFLTAKAINDCSDEIGGNTNDSKKAFIALKFNENNVRINAIQDAISQAGFEPVIMNQLETNDWIMPEIFHQIEESRFVVVDFSLPCDGAYYEAGYAAASGKPVIHLFDKREERDNNKLHFDIAQKSTIFYKDFDDLKKRLINRINATIK